MKKGIAESKTNNLKLPYDFDLHFDIKSKSELVFYIKQLEIDLAFIKKLVDFHNIDIGK